MKEKEQDGGVRSSLIAYPEEINSVLERYCNAHRIVERRAHRTPKNEVVIQFFKKWALEALIEATKSLEQKVAAIPPKVPGRRGRPPGSGVKRTK